MVTIYLVRLPPEQIIKRICVVPSTTLIYRDVQYAFFISARQCFLGHALWVPERFKTFDYYF
jgi:hypothetical protein